MTEPRNGRGISGTLFTIVISIVLALTAALWRTTDVKAEKADSRSQATQNDVSEMKGMIGQMINQLNRIEDRVKR